MASKRPPAWVAILLIGGALLVAFILVDVTARAYVVEPYRMPSGSMAPTILAGDSIVVTKYAYRGGQIPERGDIVAFEYPRDRTVNYIKRVVGLPGDVVEFRNDRVILDGVEQPTTAQADEVWADSDCRQSKQASFLEQIGDRTHRIFTNLSNPGPLADRDQVHVPPDAVFVVGDNRDNSEDSRRWGLVPLDHVLGRVTSIVNSVDPCTGQSRPDRFNLPL